MATSKSKLLTQGKSSSPVKLGASTSSKSSSPLMPGGKKKDYKKKGASEPADFGVPSFGLTGLTGES